MERELRLLRPEVRRSREQVEELLDPAFVEFGASGRRWERSGIVAALAAEPADGEPASADDIAAIRLADDLVHVTYVSVCGTRRSRRSSLWRGSGGRWRLYFHQGTPIPEAE